MSKPRKVGGRILSVKVLMAENKGEILGMYSTKD